MIELFGGLRVNGYARITFPAARFGHILLLVQVEASDNALGDAGRLQALIDSVFAQIALHRLAGLGVPLGDVSGTGVNTLSASNAHLLVDKNNAIFRALLNGPGGADRYAPRVFTVKAGNKRERHPWGRPHPSGAYLINSAKAGTLRKPLIGLAMHFT